MSYAFEDAKYSYMALEYCPGGELFQLVNSTRNGLPKKLVKFYGACILLGLEFLHKQKIIFKDLKTENVVISK